MKKENLQRVMALNSNVSSGIGGFTASITLLILVGNTNLLMVLGYLSILGALATTIAGKTNIVDKLTKNDDIDRIIKLVFGCEVLYYSLMTVAGFITCATHRPSIYIYTFVANVLLYNILSAPKSTYKFLRKDLAFDTIEEYAKWNTKVTTNDSMWMLIGAGINVLLLNVVAKKLNMSKEQMAYVILFISQFTCIFDIAVSVVEHKAVSKIRNMKEAVLNEI